MSDRTVSTTLLAGVRILLVEDDADSRELLSQGLEFLGATVRVAETAKAAVDIAHDNDVVVTDLALPDHDGFWLLERLKASERAIPVVLVSGYAPFQIPRLAEAPFDLKLLKPVDVVELGRLIAALLAPGGLTRK
jgi:CheY-like chemotaxis protein